MGVPENIDALLVKYDITADRLASIAEVTPGAVSGWRHGSTPRKSAVEKITDYFGLSYDDIMSDSMGLAAKEHGRFGEASCQYVDIPLYGKISAGTPIEMLPVDDTFVIPAAMSERYPDAFLLKVEGESMNRRIPNGSYALVSPTSEVVDGKAYAVCVNGFDATIKRVRKLANGFELSPDSTDPTYRAKVYDFGEEETEEITVMGRVVWYCVPFDYDI